MQNGVFYDLSASSIAAGPLTKLFYNFLLILGLLSKQTYWVSETYIRWLNVRW